MAWGGNEVAMAVIRHVLEPFKELHSIGNPVLEAALWNNLSQAGPPPPERLANINRLINGSAEYKVYQESWRKSLLLPQKTGAQEREEAVREQYKSIERFAELCENHNQRENRESVRGSLRAAFWDMPRLLHFSRVASEQADVPTLNKIKTAILDRWVAYQARIQAEHSPLGLQIEAMYGRALGEEFPNAFNFPDLSSMKVAELGIELKLSRDTPKRPALGDKDIVFTEDDEREYFRMVDTDETWVFLKTPRTVRHAAHQRSIGVPGY